MRRSGHRIALLFALVSCTALTACKIDRLWISPEARAAALFPLDPKITAQRAALLGDAGRSGEANKRIERLIDEGLLARIRGCMRGEKRPGRFDSDQVLKQAVDTACVEEADQALHVRLGFLQIGRLSSMPPLRPKPSAVPQHIVRRARLTQPREAGVVFFRGDSTLGVADIASDRVLMEMPWKDTIWPNAVSPNGRLFAMPDRASKSTTVWSSETGEVVASLPGIWSLAWVSPHLVYVWMREGVEYELRLVDLDSGAYSGRDSLPRDFEGVIGPWDSTGQFIAIGRSRVLLQPHRNPDKLSLEVRSAWPGWRSPDGLFRGEMAVNGSYWVEGKDDEIIFTSIPSFERTAISLGPGVKVWTVTPTANPDECIVQLQHLVDSWAVSREYVYSRRRRTLAATVWPPGAEQAKAVWWWSVGRLARSRSDGVDFIDRVERGPEVDVELVHAKFLDEENQRKLKEAASKAAADAGNIDPMPVRANSGTAGQAVSLAAAARNARVEAVAVSASDFRAGAGSKFKDRLGQVLIQVRSTGKPLVIVVSSRDAVRWVIREAYDSHLVAVLVTGHPSSIVEGVPRDRVVDIGTAVMDKAGTAEFEVVQQAVRRVIGRSIERVQHEPGSYVTVGMR